MMRFRIADRLWDGARPDREEEWRHALLDLNHEHDGEPPILTFDRRDDGGAAVSIEREPGPRVEVVLSFDLLRDPFRDYREIIQRLARSSAGAYGSREWESLDYAKKLVHDDAGLRVRKALRPHLTDSEPIDLKLARRLFTLIFLIAQDLPRELVTRHRSHGLP
jgi:uncharacterized protein (UPF0262 family)